MKRFRSFVLAGLALGTLSAGAEPLARRPDCPVAARTKSPCRPLVEMEVQDVVPLKEAQAHAVVLVTKDHARVLPIFVDEVSAVAIAFRLAHQPTPNPLAQDLLDRMVTQLGGTVVGIHIDDVRAHVFMSHVFVQQGSKRLDFDARPSDALSMALSQGAPIWVSEPVIQKAGIKREDIEALRKETQRGVGGSGPSHDISL